VAGQTLKKSIESRDGETVMPAKPKPVPEGTHTLAPHLAIRNAAKVPERYPKAFGAEVLHVTEVADGQIMHAELKIGDSKFMLHDEVSSIGSPAPETLGGSPVVLHICVEDVDALWNRAVAAGVKVATPLANQFWGDRYGEVVDPFGHRWALRSHVEDVAPEEMKRRLDAAFAQMKQKASA
jgi:PhnB protein